MIHELKEMRSNPVLGPRDRARASLGAIFNTMTPGQRDIFRNRNIKTETGLRDAIAVYALSQVMKNEKSLLRVPLTALIVDSFAIEEDRFRRTPDDSILMLDGDGQFVASRYTLLPAIGERRMYREVEYLTGPRRNEAESVHVHIPLPHEGQVSAAEYFVTNVDKLFVSPETV